MAADSEKARKLTRRRVLELGVGAALAPSVLGATAGPALAGRLAELASTQRRSGTLRIGINPNLTDKLDPALMIGTSAELVAAPCLYNTLVRTDLRYRVYEDLATDWTASRDARTFTFRLVRNARFHNGRRVTSRDVAYTFRRLLTESLGSQAYGQISPYLDPGGISTPDPTTVRFRLKAPNAFFPIILSNYNYHIVPDGTTDFSKGIGSGPFRLRRFEPGASLELERNDEYFKSGKPYFDEVIAVAIADDTARVQALLSGNIQISPMPVTAPSLVSQIERSRNTNLLVFPSGAWATLVCRTVLDPFKDIRVVQALKYGIDRAKFGRVAFGGRATVTPDIPIPPGDPFFPPGMRPWPYDPERARSLLRQAGYRDGIDLTLYARPGNFLDFATAAKEIYRASGIRVEIKVWPADTYWSEVWLKVPFMVDYWGRLHASVILPLAYGSGSSSNETAFSNRRFDRLIAQAPRTTDPQKQKALYWEALRILQDRSGSVIPVHTPLYWGKARRLRVREQTWLGVYWDTVSLG